MEAPMLTLALLLACSTPNNADADADGPAGKATQEDVDALLDRLEALEAEVVALRNAGAPVGIDADADGDGLREWDGLPVGTRRGDVLYEFSCSLPGRYDFSPPAWLTPSADPRVLPSWTMWYYAGGEWIIVRTDEMSFPVQIECYEGERPVYSWVAV